jgi:hypothetical protein
MRKVNSSHLVVVLPGLAMVPLAVLLLGSVLVPPDMHRIPLSLVLVLGSHGIHGAGLGPGRIERGWRHPPRVPGRDPGRDVAAPGEHRLGNPGRRRWSRAQTRPPPGNQDDDGGGDVPPGVRRSGNGIVLPGDDDRSFVDHTIYNELALGQVSPETRQRYLGICARHIETDGIDAVILGCAEIPLVILSDDLSVGVLDTTRIHVAAILAAAS